MVSVRRWLSATPSFRVLCACLASLLLYGLAFGFIVDRPLGLGFLQHQLDAKIARAASLDRKRCSAAVLQ